MQLRNRVDVVTVGRLSLNFTGFNRESASIFGNQLYSLIQKLVPYSQAIPLSIEYLNTATLQPRKDNKSERYVLLDCLIKYQRYISIVLSLTFI
jgi:hypothetical protein